MTEKEHAIRAVLEKRTNILRDRLIPKAAAATDKAYYEGKKDGYLQAIELLGDSLECIKIELKP